MLAFVLGAISAFFGVLAMLQLFTETMITLDGVVKKSDDPARYWVVTAAYGAACLGTLQFVLRM